MNNIKIYYGSDRVIGMNDRVKQVPPVAIVDESQNTAFIFTKNNDSINLKIKYTGPLGKTKNRVLKLPCIKNDQFFSEVFEFLVYNFYQRWNKFGTLKSAFFRGNTQGYPIPVSYQAEKIMLIDEKEKNNRIDIGVKFKPYSISEPSYGFENITFTIPNKKEVNYTLLTNREGENRTPYGRCNLPTLLSKFLMGTIRKTRTERLTKREFDKKFISKQNVND